jgi:hypothetical protein
MGGLIHFSKEHRLYSVFHGKKEKGCNSGVKTVKPTFSTMDLSLKRMKTGSRKKAESDYHSNNDDSLKWN